VCRTVSRSLAGANAEEGLRPSHAGHQGVGRGDVVAVPDRLRAVARERHRDALGHAATDRVPLLVTPCPGTVLRFGLPRTAGREHEAPTPADLTEAHLSQARLEGARLIGARYDDATQWPEGVMPQGAGFVKAVARSGG